MALTRHVDSARRASQFLGRSDGGLLHRVLRSGVWVGLQTAGQSVLQTVRSIILARLLTPEIFGLMGLCQVAIRGLDLFTETGIAPALIQRQDRVEEAKDTAYTLQILRGFVLALLAMPLAPLAAAYYGEPRLRNVILVLSAAFIISGFSNINTILLQKKLDFRRLAYLELTVAFISTVAVSVLAWILRSVWALVIGQILTSLMRVALTYIIVPGRPTMRFDKQIAKELFGYGRFITGLTIVLFITSEIDNMVVGKVIGFQQLGLYTMAFTLANLPATHIAKIASNVIFPAYSSIQNDLGRIRLAYMTVLRVVGAISIPAAAGLATLAPEILRIVYGQRWVGAAGALRILALFGAARAIGMLGGYLYNAIGKPNISFYLSATKLAVILAIIYPMTAAYGLEGAATAVAVPQVAGDTIGLLIVRGQIGLPLSSMMLVIGRVLACCAVMIGVLLGGVRLLEPVGPLDLVIIILAGMLVYGALIARELLKLLAEIKAVRSKKAASVQAPPPAIEPAAEPGV
jgi:O-antigen/teichoic acid export membrane protein